MGEINLFLIYDKSNPCGTKYLYLSDQPVT
jgi:hypothetical protein